MIRRILIFTTFSVLFLFSPSFATEIVMRDGRVISGKLGRLAGLGGDKQMYVAPDSGQSLTIVFLDDDLRRTFVSQRLVVKVGGEESLAGVDEVFDLPQKVKDRGPGIAGVGLILKHSPFDEHGRRTITMATTKGPKDLIQCITQLTPHWMKVECTNYVWDMRMATTNIGYDELIPILRHQALRTAKGDEVEAAKKIARFFIQADRFEEAARELNRVIHLAKVAAASENGESGELSADALGNLTTPTQRALAPTLALVHQLRSQRRFDELEFRRQHGQHWKVRSMLQVFPTENVAGETLMQVREILADYQQMEQRIERIIAQLQADWAKLEDSRAKDKLKPLVQEITFELNFNTLQRMSAFERVLDVAGESPQDRLALGVTAWLMGSRNASSKIMLAVSAMEVRGIMEDYMRAESAIAREAVFQKFHSQEAANVNAMSAILSHMKPPVKVKEEEWLNERHDFCKIQTAATATEKPVTYWVQLPPEYDPHRMYPVVIALGGLGNTPLTEMGWWAGGFNAKGERHGVAGRHGYIVVTPQWSYEGQRECEFSRREHDSVLHVLRDVSQRFSVDSDRVFLAGHFDGGEAAWDIGLAHPDLWAGIILFSCHAKGSVRRCHANGKYVPIYYVCGELDGRIMVQNSYILSGYLAGGYDTTVVEYLGRGKEDFPDEIQRIFDWMGRKRRNFYPEKFAVSSVRPTDNFFWWVEMNDFPDRIHSGKEVKLEAVRVPAANTLKVKIPSARAKVWIGPKMLDYERKVNILVNGTNLIGPRTTLAPSIRVLMEDFLARGDRQNPFFQVVEFPVKKN